MLGEEGGDGASDSGSDFADVVSRRVKDHHVVRLHDAWQRQTTVREGREHAQAARRGRKQLDVRPTPSLRSPSSTFSSACSRREGHMPPARSRRATTEARFAGTLPRPVSLDPYNGKLIRSPITCHPPSPHVSSRGCESVHMLLGRTLLNLGEGNMVARDAR